jgi:hypothetical protein
VAFANDALGLRPFLAALCCGLACSCAIPIIGATHGRQREHAENGEQAHASARGRGSAASGAQARRVPAALARARPLTVEGFTRGGDDCYAALAAEGVSFERVAARDAFGVRTPVRLRGPLRGVEVVASGRHRTHAILDCRLALALLWWTPALRDAGVVRVEHYSIYRPGARTAGEGRVSGHARGMAIDAARFHLRNGEVLDVLTDWEDRDRGGAPCPQRPDEGRPSRVLRGVVCDAVEGNLFQVVLTPHHDRAHGNHVHLEIRPDVDWSYVR